ncbi:hypothetical protein BWH33_23065 [Salmonella enterica subsp. enterica serovar Thompson]|nr:hypothetical protein [Salmonella enterica subsp. enterica serovar Thompson]
MWGLVIAIPVYCFFVRKIKKKIKSPVDYIKFFVAIGAFSAITVLFTAVTMTYYLPGVTSSYTTHYKYSERTGKGDCSGGIVEDPDLGEIKICYPAGNYSFDNYIYVEKRSNHFGAVVTYAITHP